MGIYPEAIIMKVIIIGKGRGWENAPVEGETWGVNDLVVRRPVKLVFEMHNTDLMLEQKPEYMQKLIEKIDEFSVPVVTQKKHEFFPAAIPFPLDEMPVKYFTSSIAYMVAYAIYKKATEIEMFGVALGLEGEYIEQRPCAEFWIGYAMAKGIKITVHKPTTIECCKSHQDLYGYNKIT